MRGAVYVNGQIAAAGKAVVPVYDHGFVYGEGVYETLRTYNRVPFLYDRHMRRLRQSAERLSSTCRSTMRRCCMDSTQTAGRRRRARRGLHPRPADARRRRAHLRLKATPKPTTRHHRQAARAQCPQRVTRDGIRSRSSICCAIIRSSVNPIIKSNNLLNNALAMQAAHRRGGEEALMCNYRGELSECSQSNFFMVRDGVALTPKSEAGLLEGITRAFLFEVGRDARDRGARRRRCSPQDLATRRRDASSPSRRAS